MVRLLFKMMLSVAICCLVFTGGENLLLWISSIEIFFVNLRYDMGLEGI